MEKPFAKPIKEILHRAVASHRLHQNDPSLSQLEPGGFYPPALQLLSVLKGHSEQPTVFLDSLVKVFDDEVDMVYPFQSHTVRMGGAIGHSAK